MLYNVMLYNMCYVMDICYITYVMLYKVCYITYVMLCYTTYVKCYVIKHVI